MLGFEDSAQPTALTGVVELLQNGESVGIVRGGTPEARNPLSQNMPRRHTAVVASNKIELLVIDSDLLDVMLTWDQTGSYEVGELGATGKLLEVADDGDDWMTALLQTKAFHKVPPANIQAIFMRMQRVDVRTGEIIIKQGDEGDYFYVIVKGKCLVTRDTPLNKDGVKLAELGIGESFGEEALISDAKRNANVTMLTDGSLMRLNKEDFKSLLNEPLLEYVDVAQAQKLAAQGAVWLDVRLPSEFENKRLPRAVNIPLYFMRLKLKTLDRKLNYICYCDTGRRSSAAAYILSERGFHSYVLRGGLQAIPANLLK
ncbi:MAG TPA: cyclic nucleotide-binding domain-containing protein [Steroidobacteraceae bacterium]|nr:cyclic nucleotide-binding domain-containing protein [Steroidobacteraceae bacterium]